MALSIAGLNLSADTVTLTNTNYPGSVNHFRFGSYFNDRLSNWGFQPTLTLDAADNRIVVNVNAAPGQMFEVDASAPGVSNVNFHFFLSYLGNATSLGTISNGSWSFDMVAGAAPVFNPSSFAAASASHLSLTPHSLAITGYTAFTGFSFSYDFSGTPDTTLSLGSSYINVFGNTTGTSPILGLTSASVPETTSTLALILAALVALVVPGRKRRADGTPAA